MWIQLAHIFAPVNKEYVLDRLLSLIFYLDQLRGKDMFSINFSLFSIKSQQGENQKVTHWKKIDNIAKQKLSNLPLLR